MNKFIFYIFPLTVLSFDAVGIEHLNVVFNTITRWVFLGVLIVALLFNGRLFSGLRGRFGVMLAIYLAWCVGTIAWSEAPLLSLLKSTALVLMITTLASAGYFWSLQSKHERVLDYLWPIVLATLFSGLSNSPSDSYEIGAGIVIYQGLTGNPNYLGIIAAMSLPLSLHLVYRNRADRVRAIGAVILTALLAYLLWRSASRASALCALTVGMGLVMAMNASKKIVIVVLGGALVLAAILAAPELQSGTYQRFVIKGAVDREGQILMSRTEVWNRSYQNALEGGVLGGGYGVTIGETPSSAELYSAVGYGREKGNSQLGIWEETGLVGLALYGVFIVFLLADVWGTFGSVRNPSRIEMGLLAGVISGLLLQSVFEAWWGAPGSAESAYFWAAVGVARGLMRRAEVVAQKRQPKYQMNRAFAASQFR